MDRDLDLHPGQVGDHEHLLVLVDPSSWLERAPPVAPVGIDDHAALRGPDGAVLDLLPKIGEFILLGFEPVRLQTLVDLRRLDPTS